MFGWELPPCNSGGLGVACYGLSRALAQQNIDITFVLPQKSVVKVDFMKIVFADLENIVWPLLSPYDTNWIIHGNMPQDLINAVLLYAARAESLAKKHHCDLIHAHDWLCFPAGITASRTTHVPLVTHVHATEFDRSGGLSVNPAVFNLEKNGLDYSSAVIAISNFTGRLLSGRYGTPSHKLHIVHNGIDSSLYPDDETSGDLLLPLKEAGYKIVLYVGRLTLQKGPDYFLKAAELVLRYNPKTVFLVAGSGDMEGQMIQQVAQMGISDKVLFTGFLRDELLNQVYRSADLFVMPSVSEPFGLTALESVANGTPAIISKQSGVSEVLSHVLKVDFWDTEEMANQILSVLKYAPLPKTMSTNGKKEVKKVSWKAAAAKTIDIYKKVLSGK
jgi:glycogen(starch) synthase